MSKKSNRAPKSLERSRVKKAKRPAYRSGAWLVAAIAVGVGVISALAYWSNDGDRGAPSPSPTEAGRQMPRARAMPVFHDSAEAAKPFPALMPPSRYQHPVVSRAYAIAHEIPEVLAQQPCYCYCETSGHRSLLDCWASDHGAG